MPEWLIDTIGILFVLTPVVLLIMTQYQRSWQNTAGFVLTMAAMPLAFLVMALLVNVPVLGIGAVFAFGVLCAHRKPTH